MHAFSISAPQLTEEQHQRELNELTKEERNEIQQAVTGTARFVENSSMMERGLQEFHREIQMIPSANKEAYMEAIRRVPHLVETETNPIKFLRCEHYDAKKAAQRMVRNWEMRLVAFGEKAFEPMTLEGALSNDIETVKTGFFQLLRDGSEKDRAILLFDRPKLSHSMYNRDSAYRIMWYLFHVASEHAFTQCNGAILIIDALAYTLEYFDRKLCRKLYQLLEECTAMKLSAVHVCTVKSRSTYTIIMPSVLALMGRRNRLRTTIHPGPLYVEGLRKSGLSTSCIPTELGGDVTAEHHQEWVEYRRKVEQELVKGPIRTVG